MPRKKVTHLNSPENDTTTICGKHLARVEWTLEPVQVTCLACKRVMQPKPARGRPMGPEVRIDV